MHTYPEHLTRTLTLRDGTPVTIRAIRPSDAGIEQEFVRGLSDESRYYRFMDMLRELSPEMLRQFTDIDYYNRLALIAVITRFGCEVEIAVGRYVALPDGESCEFAIVVGDAWQKQGIATAVVRLLIDAARQRGLKKMMGEVLAGNHRMLNLVARLGFHSAPDPEDPALLRVTLAL